MIGAGGGGGGARGNGSTSASGGTTLTCGGGGGAAAAACGRASSGSSGWSQAGPPPVRICSLNQSKQIKAPSEQNTTKPPWSTSVNIWSVETISYGNVRIDDIDPAKRLRYIRLAVIGTTPSQQKATIK